MTMVVGGGIMPLIQHAIAQNAGAITSYWLVIAMLAYILYYSKIGCKNVNKKPRRFDAVMTASACELFCQFSPIAPLNGLT